MYGDGKMLPPPARHVRSRAESDQLEPGIAIDGGKIRTPGRARGRESERADRREDGRAWEAIRRCGGGDQHNTTGYNQTYTSGTVP